MKLNTHNRTPKSETSKKFKAFFIFSYILIYVPFVLASFGCFYYEENLILGILILLIPILISVIIFIIYSDMEKAYVDIKEDKIYVVDYYFCIKKEKQISFSDITRAEILLSSSHKIKGYRVNFTGITYIVFYKDKKYLFKIMCLPETEEIFKQYIK